MITSRSYAEALLPKLDDVVDEDIDGDLLAHHELEELKERGLDKESKP